MSARPPSLPALHRDLDELAGAPDAGHPLEPGVRARLERFYRAELADVGIHEGGAGARTAAELGADAITIGNQVHFADGAYRPQEPDGFELLAHEVAHVLQQASGQLPAGDGWYIGCGDDAWERSARDLAAAAVRGDAGVRIEAGDVASLPEARHRAVQCHDSFEHRALGDLSTDDVVQVAGGPQRTTVVEREVAMQYLWQHDPEKVTEEQLRKVCPNIRTLRLQESGLLVTYGELNALPDYIATGAVADTIPKAVVLPILQYVRQESYNSLNALVGHSTNEPFAGAVFSPAQWLPGLINRLLESLELDALTTGLGSAGVDHYTALLGRNACHFAPFSWHRWQASYVVALDLARRAHAASDPNERAALEHQAWVQHGYADHFLQDSFAAGHLVNKTLIMQWFVDWAAGQRLVPVFDWDAVRKMGSAAQPGLAGRVLYDHNYPGGSNDPQTAEDQAAYADRLRTTGLETGASGTLDGAYQDYFAFLSSLITQSASASIHDYYNSNSLWVASTAHPEPYEVWGDDTFFSGGNAGDGARVTSEAAQLSQESIQEVLSTGDSSIKIEELLDRFPTRVRSTGGELLGLEQWNNTQQQFCADAIFPELHDIVLRIANPQITNVSRDEDLAARWSIGLPGADDAKASVLILGTHLYVGSNGYVHDIDAASGDLLGSVQLGASGETRLTSDGNTVFAGLLGHAYGLAIDGPLRVAWTASLSGAATNAVDVLTASGSVFAGSNGYVYQLDRSSGQVRRSLLLGSIFGRGDYTMRLAVSGSVLIAGSHGYVYGVRPGDLGKAWECELTASVPGLVGYNPVEVLVANGQIYAGSNGFAFQVAGNGTQTQYVRLSDLIHAPGDYTTTLAANAQMLFVGCHGYVYGVSLRDWSGAAWSADLAGNRYTMINLAVSGDQLLAGSYGYVFRVDVSGRLVRTQLITSAVGVGDYETRLAFNDSGDTVFAGAHGWAYKLSALVR